MRGCGHRRGRIGKMTHDHGPYQIAIKADADEDDAAGSPFLFGRAFDFSSVVSAFGCDLCSALACLHRGIVRLGFGIME